MGDSLINRPGRIHTFAPIVDTSAYSSGDQMGSSVITIPDFFPKYSLSTGISSAVVIDSGKSISTTRILLFNEAPTLLSVDNAPLDISDADMQSKFIGDISLSSSVSLVNNSFVSSPTSRVLRGKSSNLYIVLMAGATFTIATSSSLVFKLIERR